MTTALRLARQIDNLLQNIPADEESWLDSQTRLHRAQAELQQTVLLQEGLAVELNPLRDGLQMVRFVLQGDRLAPTTAAARIESEIATRERILDEREQDTLEKYLLGEVAEGLRKGIAMAAELVEQMTHEVSKRPMKTGMQMRFRWRQDEEGPPGLGEACEVLSVDSATWSPEERDQIKLFLQRAIRQQREQDETGSWHEHMQAALDYRRWHRIIIERRKGPDANWIRLTRKTYAGCSGGEKAIALTLPPIAAAAAYYQTADPHAPRFILLDEAFAGISSDNRESCMELIVEFGLDAILTSESEWGMYPGVPQLAICQLDRFSDLGAVVYLSGTDNTNDRRCRGASSTSPHFSRRTNVPDPLVELLRAEECSPLLSRLRKKIQRGESLNGQCRLSRLTREQATRISELTGASGRGASIGVDLGRFAQIVVNTGRFETLESLVQLACGEPLPNLRAARDEHSAQWQQVWAHAGQLVRELGSSPARCTGAETGRTATQTEPFTTNSLNEAIASMRKSGWLRRLTSRDPIAATSLFVQSFALLKRLPVYPAPLAVVAAKHCGSAHALDDNTSLGRIMLKLLAEQSVHDIPEKNAVERRHIWESVGIVTDELSSTVLTLNLLAAGDSLSDRLLQDHRRCGMPARLTFRHLRLHPPTFGLASNAHDSRIYVCENPSILAEAANRIGANCPPMVCVEGHPSLACWLLLEQLCGSGFQLAYHGDFDWGAKPGRRRCRAGRIDGRLTAFVGSSWSLGDSRNPPELVLPNRLRCWTTSLGPSKKVQ